MSEKTEKPTDKKLKDLKKKGDVSKSDELASSFQFMISIFIILLFGKGVVKDIIKLINTMTTNLKDDTDLKINFFIEFVIESVFFLCFLMFTFAVISFVFTWSQTGIIFANEKVKPSLKKLNIASNFKNIFSLKNIIEQCKAIIKIFFFFCFLFLFVSFFIIDIVNSFNLSAINGFVLLLFLIKWLWSGTAVIFIMFALVDIFIQRKLGEKNTKMSKDEIKREYKDSEGNPELKQERKRLHHEIQSGSLSQAVKKSTLILKNPTHILVLIYYKAGITPLPMILNYGEGTSVKPLLEIAEQNGIPVIENITLARELRKKVKAGEFITEEFFEPIAELLRLVMNIEY
ncbi:EscU/YscU/HrcU family type III secretion system export apparatus switch protein [Salmonella enterica]|nr:EscU/YscU/HrcU family type III secretion system export apparatus switch protein [Salmonella enterica]EFV4531875.1 EscU/YscU/HrcU family type III secretion system export apparatus switch protein [Salmonella enterica]EHF3428771.1 EscU/YscU/HrcU family type III secretion system export apparatus switch protein [Salmonella enterica]